MPEKKNTGMMFLIGGFTVVSLFLVAVIGGFVNFFPTPEQNASMRTVAVVVLAVLLVTEMLIMGIRRRRQD